MKASAADPQSSSESFDLGQYKKAASIAYQFAKQKAEKTQAKEPREPFA